VKQREPKLKMLVMSPHHVQKQKPPFTGKPFRFRFPAAPRLSQAMAEVKGLSEGYSNGANSFFLVSDLSILKGDCIAVS
jgi:hypothetical protein